MENREGIGTFTVLEFSDGKSGRKLRRREPSLVRVPVPGGSFFYVLRAPRRCDMREMLRLAGRCAPVVLTALPVPPDAGVRLFEPRIFPMRRAAAALCAILPLTRLPPQKCTLGVFDPDGVLCGGTHALPPLASDVRIVTRQPDVFADDALFARRRFGVSLTVGEDASMLARCDAVVCERTDAAFRDVPVILSCMPSDGVFSLLPVCLPDSLARLRPRSIEPDRFASALAEKCGVHVPEWFGCTGVLFAGRPMQTEQAASLWRERIRKKARTGENRERQMHTGACRDVQGKRGRRIFLDNWNAV